LRFGEDAKKETWMLRECMRAIEETWSGEIFSGCTVDLRFGASDIWLTDTLSADAVISVDLAPWLPLISWVNHFDHTTGLYGTDMRLATG
jgi:hypothetical protein